MAQPGGERACGGGWLPGIEVVGVGEGGEDGAADGGGVVIAQVGAGAQAAGADATGTLWQGQDLEA
jgi:hypothetical protein